MITFQYIKVKQINYGIKPSITTMTNQVLVDKLVADKIINIFGVNQAIITSFGETKELHNGDYIIYQDNKHLIVLSDNEFNFLFNKSLMTKNDNSFLNKVDDDTFNTKKMKDINKKEKQKAKAIKLEHTHRAKPNRTINKSIATENKLYYININDKDNQQRYNDLRKLNPKQLRNRLNLRQHHDKFDSKDLCILALHSKSRTGLSKQIGYDGSMVGKWLKTTKNKQILEYFNML